MNAACTDLRARRARPSARAWFRTKALAASGGRTASAKTSGPVDRSAQRPLRRDSHARTVVARCRLHFTRPRSKSQRCVCVCPDACKVWAIGPSCCASRASGTLPDRSRICSAKSKSSRKDRAARSNHSRPTWSRAHRRSPRRVSAGGKRFLPRGLRGFVILESAGATAANVFVPPDAFTCADCLRELSDPQRSSPWISLHQLHAMRAALHADRHAAVRSQEHDDGRIRAVRSSAPRSIQRPAIVASTPSRWHVPRAARICRSSRSSVRRVLRPTKHCCKRCGCSSREPCLPSRASAAIT